MLAASSHVCVGAGIGRLSIGMPGWKFGACCSKGNDTLKPKVWGAGTPAYGLLDFNACYFLRLGTPAKAIFRNVFNRAQFGAIVA